MVFIIILGFVVGGGVGIIQNYLDREQDGESQTAKLNKNSNVEANEYMQYKSTRIANLITSITRPVLTLLMLIFVLHIFNSVINVAEGGVILKGAVNMFNNSIVTFQTIVSYWFVRRSYEKKKSF